MSTSGTTAYPKLVHHNFQSLSKTVKYPSKKNSNIRWGMIYDYTRFAGMQVLLQALISGSTIIQPSINQNLEQQIKFLIENDCTHLSATPTMWRKIIMTKNSKKLSLTNITLGGEIADQKILDTLKSVFRDAKIRHIFASTEAGVGFSVSDGKPGFPKSFLKNNPYNIELKISETRLWIKNKLVGKEYLGKEGNVSINNWVDTGDNVKIIGDRVIFLGRESGSINVGGNKIHPEYLENVILDHPKVFMVMFIQNQVLF